MFYTYLWLRENGTPYYVGKGTGNRAFWRHGRKGTKPPDDYSRVLIQEFISEQDALFAEKFLISYYGRVDLGTGCLRNLTDGGDGSSGYRHTKAELQKMSAVKKDQLSKFNCWNGRKHTVDAKRKQSIAHRKKLSENQIIEIRQLRREGNKQEYIAVLFGITQSHVSRICSCQCYKF